MKTRILFVDDEPLVLQGLQRMLRGERRNWDMEFASSGQEALARLDAQPFDVVVSDMRMPGMDGAQLLNEVMRRHPRTVRFILSGHADRSMVMRCVGATHQFLSKPCDVENLRSTISRASALRGALMSEELQRLVGCIRELPSLPRLYQEIQSCLAEPEVDLTAIGALVAQDVGMTAEILKLVNSSFFGLGRGISNAEDAVGYLGVETVKILVLSMHVFGDVDPEVVPSEFVERLRRHSADVASLARAIAELEGMDRVACDSAFASGMLHDIGRLILRQHLPERWLEAQRRALAGNLPFWRAEVEVFGACHADLGAYLLGLWGLPHPVVEAIKYLHTPSHVPGVSFSPLTVLHAAHAVVHESDPTEDDRSELDLGYFQRLRIADRLPVWSRVLKRTRCAAAS